MKKINLYILILIVFSINCLNVFSQNSENTDSTQNSKFKKFEMKKSSTNAILYSLLFPGAGQLYVESYWKAPLFAAGTGVLIYFIIDNNTKYNTKETEYQKAKEVSPLGYQTVILKSQKEYYRDIRDQSAFYLVGVYLIAAIDAYVGAHLFDFNVSDQVKLNISPNISPTSSYISFKINF
jgi:hypothetical protein